MIFAILETKMAKTTAKILEKTIKNPLLWQKSFKKILEVMDAF